MSPSVLLERSPLDSAPPSVGGQPVRIGDFRTPPRWVPSRYNVRATTEDGSLILWNSYRGTMSAFQAHQKEAILACLRGTAGKRGGLVEYLVERGFLLPEGTDEMRRLEYAFGQEHYRSDTLELILLASEDCNFRCTYCYESFVRGTMRPEVRESVKKLIENRLDGLRHLRVSWFGGEPLYGFEAVEDLAPFFVDVAEKHSLSFPASHMTTNGYLLTPEVAKRLLAWQITDYQITIDGPPEQHDGHRPTRTGEGTFSTIFSNLEAMSRRGEEFSLTLRMNFDQENHPHLSAFLEKVEKSFGGDSRFSTTFRAVGRWGGANDEGLAVCGHEEATRVSRELREEARRRGLPVDGTLRDVRGLGSQVCYAARPHNFIVGADGRLMKCTVALDADDANVVGRILPDGELELDDDKMALWTEPAFANDGQCRKCVIAPTCQGVHCPKIRIRENRRPCPETRMQLKAEMLEMYEESRGSARQVAVRRSA